VENVMSVQTHKLEEWQQGMAFGRRQVEEDFVMDLIAVTISARGERRGFQRHV
jgi:hypothetical protein